MKEKCIFLLRALALLTGLSASFSATAQVEFNLLLQPDGHTYTLLARSQSSWSQPTDNITYSAQVTVLVPTGTFELTGLVSHVGIWQLTNLIEHPAENPGTDYAIFNLVGATQDILYEPGVESQLFSFQNAYGCTGIFEIINPETDPFSPPNSLNVPAGNEIFVEGAGGDAYTGNYGARAANCFQASNCLLSYQLESTPDGRYQVSVLPDAAFQPASPVEMVQVAIKVPAPYFEIYEPKSLLPGILTLGNSSRFDSPAESPGFDYIQFRLNATGQGLSLQPGVKVPLLSFANGGSCQGDSIYLVKNNDSFLPPNSQGANIAQQVSFFAESDPVIVCTKGKTSALCRGCLFAGNFLKIDSIQTADPVACLGSNNGTLQIFSNGGVEYSIDGGLSWSKSNHFGGLSPGVYEPIVRGNYYGCPLTASVSSAELNLSAVMTLHLDMPPKACEGDDVLLKIMSPNPLPVDGIYQWTGPAGFSAIVPDPVLLNVKNYQSGTYTLSVQAPGCSQASATTSLQVNGLPTEPTLVANPAICFGEKLELKTDVSGNKFEWIGPLGQSPATLSTQGLTTTNKSTVIWPGHPAYLSGLWKVRVTDANDCQAQSTPYNINIKPRPQAFAENTGSVCLKDDGQLLSNPLPGAIYRWRKAGQTAVFSMQPDPVVPGMGSAQTFELQVEWDGCSSENYSLTTIPLNPMPSANPTPVYQPASDCSPKNLQLKANASGPGLNYHWEGVNGFTSQLADPLISNADASVNGSYLLEVTNVYGCTTSTPLQVTGVVDPVPMPVIQSTGAACPGEHIQLSVQVYSGSQVSYQWYKNNLPLSGQVSNQLNLNAVQTADEGNYRVKVQVDGCTLQSAELPVSLLNVPVATPDFSLSQPCEGGTLQFFSNLTGITAWHWKGPNGFTSDSPNPLIYNAKFDDIGAYSLTVTSTAGCQSTSTIVVDGILPQPASPSVATNSPVCPESEIVLQVQNPVMAGSFYYEWINGNGDYIGEGEAVLTLDPGSPEAVSPFLVRSVVNTCPSPFSAPVPVTVRPVPLALAWNGGAVCAGDAAQLFAAAVPDGQYEWRIAGTEQVIAIEQNPVYSLQDTTNFELIVKISGCVTAATATTTIPVSPAPEITGMTGGGNYCEGTPVTLSALNEVPFSGDIQYTWAGPGGFAFTAPAKSEGPFPLLLGNVQLQHQGAYTLTLYSPDGCQSTPQSVAVNVGEMPVAPGLQVADAMLCQGETLELMASPLSGNTVEYQWYFNDGSADYLLASTGYSSYFVPAVMPSNSGTYYVKAKVDGCEPPPSNLKTVMVLGLATTVQAENPTSLATPACEGSEVQLSATLIPGALYTWYGPAGFQSNAYNPLIENATPNQDGSYLVIVDLPGCSLSVTGSTSVFVQQAPELPLLTGATEVCEGTNASLSVANAQAGASYSFYFNHQPEPLLSGAGTSLMLENITPSQAGVYHAVARLNDCQSGVSADFKLTVNANQTGFAFAGEDKVVCPGGEKPLLQAAQPVNGSGHWISLDGAVVMQPNQATSFAANLHPGSNRFVWTLTNGLCPGAGSDTVDVFVESIEALPESMSVPFNGSLLNINLLENDALENAGEWEFFILKKTTKGELEEDGAGNITYTPYPNVFGVDELTYLLCSKTCPELCDTARVQFKLEGPANPAQCFVPNLISPNGDGENDVFIVPCTASYTGSSMTVFNRWGAIVYETGNYQNDWNGSYDGQPLPAGTYFYLLTLNDGAKTKLQGYITVVR